MEVSVANIIDRRGAKSTHSENRKRFIEKNKANIKKKVEMIYKGREFEDHSKVRIRLNSSEVKGFEYEGKYGNKVFAGNKKWQKGDILPQSPRGEGDSSDGILDLILDEQEFLKILFEDFSLPNLIKKESEEALISSYVRVGYALEGSPPLLNLKRSVVNGIGRGLALEEAYDEMAAELKKKIDAEKNEEIKAKITKEWSEVLENKKNILFLDKPDLRYIVKAPLLEPKTTALIYFVLDISSSVTEEARTLAKKFFYLTYCLVKQNHDKVLIKFIRHTNVAEFTNEHDFFYETGGGSTVLSSPLELIKKDLQETPALLKHNLYILQASDGENGGQDDAIYTGLIKQLAKDIQAYIYLESPNDTKWGSYPTSLPEVEALKATYSHVYAEAIRSSDDILPIFKKIFGKSGKNKG
jgi:uncharacterized sporulation protein YeaH/YhbH (DUF444 family)